MRLLAIGDTCCHPLAAGGGSIIISMAASMAGYKRKGSARGGPASCTGTAMSAPAGGVGSILGDAAVVGEGTAASYQAGAAAANLRNTGCSGAQVARSMVSASRLSMSSGGGASELGLGAMLPEALGVDFVPITLVFTELRWVEVDTVLRLL